jgi:hypothetical protein
MAELVLRLREMLNPEGGRPSYLLDGSSLELEATPSLRKAYPPGENQHGRAHWPVLRIVVLHELETGLAEEPHWGPMYGTEAVSEPYLAEKAMDALAPDSILVGDRNFGVFSIVWAAHQRGLQVVVRLTAERALKLAGGPIAEEGERPVRWTPSRFDGRRQGGMPEGASVQGRLIAVRIGRGKSKEWLYLFTTAELPREQVLALYGKRWNIETDLRSLKRTVQLHHITARNESFTFVLNVVNASWHRLQSAPDAEAYHREMFRLLDAAAEGVHPKRKKRRSFPRAAWHRRHTFSSRKESQ